MGNVERAVQKRLSVPVGEFMRVPGSDAVGSMTVGMA